MGDDMTFEAYMKDVVDKVKAELKAKAARVNSEGAEEAANAEYMQRKANEARLNEEIEAERQEWIIDEPKVGEATYPLPQAKGDGERTEMEGERTEMEGERGAAGSEEERNGGIEDMREGAIVEIGGRKWLVDIYNEDTGKWELVDAEHLQECREGKRAAKDVAVMEMEGERGAAGKGLCAARHRRPTARAGRSRDREGARSTCGTCRSGAACRAYGRANDG